MRHTRIGLVFGLLILAQLAGTSCILVPKIEKRNVSLVVSQVETVPVVATGPTNRWSGTASINLAGNPDLAQAVHDGGLDASKLTGVVVGKVEYRVAVADPTTSRTISNATATVAAGTGADTPLLTSVTFSPGVVSDWQQAPLNASGVTVVNNVLAAVLAELKGETHGTEALTFKMSGDTTPTTPATSFTYEFRLTLLISGTVETNVLN